VSAGKASIMINGKRHSVKKLIRVIEG